MGRLVPAPRRSARPLPLPQHGRQSCGAVGPPTTPSAGPFPYYGNSDIQRERLTLTAAPRLPQRGRVGRGPGCTHLAPLSCGARQQACSRRRPRPPASAGQPPVTLALAREPRARPRGSGSYAGKGPIQRFWRDPALLLVYGKVSRRAPGLHIAEQGRLSHV